MIPVKRIIRHRDQPFFNFEDFIAFQAKVQVNIELVLCFINGIIHQLGTEKSEFKQSFAAGGGQDIHKTCGAFPLQPKIHHHEFSRIKNILVRLNDPALEMLDDMGVLSILLQCRFTYPAVKDMHPPENTIGRFHCDRLCFLCP